MALQASKRGREDWSIFAELGFTDEEQAFSGSSVQTDEELTEWIGEAMITVYHAPGPVI